MQAEHEADLHWQAFCYVAGEMSDDEAQCFEEQLAVDQAAREAVTDAAQLTQAVALTDSQTPVSLRPAMIGQGGHLRSRLLRVRSRLLRAAAWTGFGAAVSLAIVLSAGWLDFRADGPTASPEESQDTVIADDGSTELAMSWIETKDEFASHIYADQDSLIDLFSALEDEAIPGEEGADGDADGDIVEIVDTEAPSWLLLAVREAQGESATEEN